MKLTHLRRSFSIGVVFFALSCAFSNLCRAKSTQALFLLCRNQKMVRTINVSVDAQTGCKVVYTKFGHDEVVANGRWTQFCLGIAKNVEANIQKSGWNCQEIKNVEILTPAQAASSKAKAASADAPHKGN